MKRHENLMLLINEKFRGSQTAFSKAIKKSKAQINQLVTGHRNVGDGVSRSIEIALGLPQGWMDCKNSSVKSNDQDSIDKSPRHKAFLDLLSALPEEEQDEIFRLLEEKKQSWERTVEKVFAQQGIKKKA